MLESFDETLTAAECYRIEQAEKTRCNKRQITELLRQSIRRLDTQAGIRCCGPFATSLRSGNRIIKQGFRCGCLWPVFWKRAFDLAAQLGRDAVTFTSSAIFRHRTPGLPRGVEIIVPPLPDDLIADASLAIDKFLSIAERLTDYAQRDFSSASCLMKVRVCASGQTLDQVLTSPTWRNDCIIIGDKAVALRSSRTGRYQCARGAKSR